MANINIGGRLHSTATGNVVAGANEILDDVKGKKQSAINQETDEALAGKQAALVSGVNIKTVNHESILGSGNIDVEGGQGGEDGVGFDSITTPATPDGTTQIILTNGDTITLDLNHQHPQYPKYVYCATQAAYDAITTKESDTLYLILETE